MDAKEPIFQLIVAKTSKTQRERWRTSKVELPSELVLWMVVYSGNIILRAICHDNGDTGR